MSADTPQQHRASSEHANKEPSAAVPVANGTAAGHKDDAQKLKGENEQLLSELQVMKRQMQVVQSREKGITKAYLGVCRDLDHVSAASSTPSCYRPAPLRLHSVGANRALAAGVDERQAQLAQGDSASRSSCSGGKRKHP